jgi:hypothetical protein
LDLTTSSPELELVMVSQSGSVKGSVLERVLDLER